MGPSLLLSLLLLPASLQAGSSKECNPNIDFGVNQPASLSAPEGGSTCISFSYFHCWELAKDPRLSIAVRRTDFHGEVIYNSTKRFIHKDYKNRISLDLREDQNSGTLYIRNLRKKDENRYFCRVQVETLRDGKQVWQSIPGTKLTITDGLQTKARTVAGESVQNTEEKYENIGITGQKTEPKLDPKDDGGILYASLTLSSSSPAAPPCTPSKESPQETLYSIVKAQ
uniref:Immunoglobulin V-set domain-containing protein n=1 Tax=Felis catus TaxID=9685 RepID=A0ABI7WEB6_FELCA